MIYLLKGCNLLSYPVYARSNHSETEEFRVVNLEKITDLPVDIFVVLCYIPPCLLPRTPGMCACMREREDE